ncbi:MAG: hypothetical protein ACRELW_14125 [Candidatus Rokuibacteriota bacterium]
MSRIHPPLASTDLAGLTEGWMRLAGPAVVGLLVGAAALAAVVVASPSTWRLLGAGRGLIPEEYFAIWGFVLTLVTMIALVAGWVAGSALAYYVLTLIALAPGWGTARLAASLVYLGLVSLPLLLYHLAFGGWLLGLPRPGVDEWLMQNHPDTYWLLGGGHPAIELSLIPLTGAFLLLLWGLGDRPVRSPLAQAFVWLIVFLSSLAVALSLTIHATLVHLRLS